MTPEEAIKTIELAKAEVEWEYPMDYAIAFEMAIKALEKQIPLIPEEIRQSDLLSCPSCFRAIKKRIENSPHDINFCPFCGQALDWGDDE